MLKRHCWANTCLVSIFRQSFRLTLILTLILTMAGCNPDAVVSNKYCNIRARFSYSPVSAISQLHAACNSTNEWCTITFEPSRIIFANMQGSTPVARTQIANYTGSILVGLTGFIVGQPPVFEMGYETTNITCYELACSNCFDKLTEKHPLTLKLFGKAYCNNCHRTYDLNNLGVIHDGEKGKPLYRYKVYFSNNTLRVDN